ncbi:MAG: HAD-IIB family hydrolase, partial [Anaerolineaceae bacterium]
SGIWAREEMVRRLKNEALEAKVIFSGGKNLDIIPQRAGKGNAIKFLRRRLAIEPSCVVVAGDSGNDLEMFTAPRKGIIVANADEDLRRLRADRIYLASGAYAAGVLEGLRYWGVLG